MTYDLSIPGQLAAAIGPEIALIVGAMVLMLMSASRPDSAEHQRTVGMGSLLVTAGVLGYVLVMARRGDSAGPGVVAVDAFRWGSSVIFLVATLITIALSIEYNAREGLHIAEIHVLTLFATSGMMLMSAARDLMVLFLGIELMSIAVYVLAGLNRRSNRSAESALKYFLLGAFSTGFLLYGIALVYGATGTTNLVEIGERVATYQLAKTPMLLVGVALLLVGFAFKIAAAPFHMWAPDVYEGAPTPITAYMAAGVKAGAFAAFLRVWLEAFPGVYSEWHKAVWWLAAITMFVGNVVALQQRNLKRMLAYSSIAHTGFILVALAAGTPQAATAFVFYLLAYTLATMGAFAVMLSLGSAGQPRDHIEDYHGLWQERPGMAIAMTVFMLALLGFPIFGGMGFFAKWYVLQAALQAPAPQTRLAVVLVITTTISAGYYLGVIIAMFMKPRPAGAAPLPVAGGMTRFVIAASMIVILFFGAWPDPLVKLVQQHSSMGGAPAPKPPAAQTANVP
jgi:NADH-quinone oxidoreductase subunit N